MGKYRTPFFSLYIGYHYVNHISLLTGEKFCYNKDIDLYNSTNKEAPCYDNQRSDKLYGENF